jgi:hypothetical protein
MARMVERSPVVVGRPGMPPADIRQWLIDNGLYWDDVGMPPEVYAQQATGRRGRGRNGAAVAFGVRG